MLSLSPCGEFTFPVLDSISLLSSSRYVMWDLANLNTNSILARRGWGPSVAAHTRSVLAARRDLLAPGDNAHHWSWPGFISSLWRAKPCCIWCLTVLSFPCQFWCPDAEGRSVLTSTLGVRQQMLFVDNDKSWSSSLWYLRMWPSLEISFQINQKKVILGLHRPLIQKWLVLL